MEKVIGSTPMTTAAGTNRGAALLGSLDEVPAVLADLAVDADLARALHLAAIRRDVSAEFRILHEDRAGGDVGSGVARIGVDPGKTVQIGVGPRQRSLP